MKQIKMIDPTYVFGKPVLQASEVRTISIASDIIEETQSWSVAHKADLVAQTEAERVQAFAEAYSDGMAEFVHAAEAYQNATQRLGDKLTFLVRKSVHRLLEIWPPEQLLEASIGPVLSEIERGAEISVSIHPDRSAVLRDVIANIANPRVSISVNEDPGLTQADCIIFTPSEVINVSINVLVDQLIEGLGDFISLADAAQQEESCD